MKYWKSRGISDKCYLLVLSDIFKNSVFFTKMDKFKILIHKKKNTGKLWGVRRLEKSGNFVS